ncbi:helix-turn-helix domain-containing protein [Rhodococcus sp. PAE-6]|uniref:helix-turn-helix domain-containing protein n=1 Tax=Rhodococcus sp. PAE-6 TaxID=2972477 RepID=UPI0021B4B402|nr:helix-turn-helix domain-containing protein [Rhodococcus sp. PAE-6]MCT7292948.1 helix-turn-helix domain-containing protein [Rhodococcus sp. PAE-6]
MSKTLRRRVLTVDELAELYGIPISTQREYRARGTSAPYFRAGNRILHRVEAVEDWIKAQERAAESDVGDTVACDGTAAVTDRRARAHADVESAPEAQRGGDES